MGTAADEGLIPRLCRTLFAKIESKRNESESVEFEVDVSFMEIYNERVRDLLTVPSRKLKVFPRSSHETINTFL